MIEIKVEDTKWDVQGGEILAIKNSNLQVDDIVGRLSFSDTPPERLLDEIPDEIYYSLQDYIDDSVYLTLVEVNHDYRVKGIGSMLLRQFIETVKTYEAMSIILSTMSMDDVGYDILTRWYRSHGFEEIYHNIDEEENHYNIMILKLRQKGT